MSGNATRTSTSTMQSTTPKLPRPILKPEGWQWVSKKDAPPMDKRAVIQRETRMFAKSEDEYTLVDMRPMEYENGGIITWFVPFVSGKREEKLESEPHHEDRIEGWERVDRA